MTTLRTLAVLFPLLATVGAHGVCMASGKSGVAGTVRDRQTGAPIAQVTVRLHRVSGEPTHASATTDANGRFLFDNLQSSPRSRFFLTYEKEGYVPHLPAYYYGEMDYYGAEPPPQSYALPLRLYKTNDELGRILGLFELAPGHIVQVPMALDKGGMFRGSLRRKTTLGPLPYTEGVQLYKRKDPASEAFLTKTSFPVAWIKPDAEGHFEVRGLVPSDKYYLRIEPAGYAAQEVTGITVTKNEVTPLDYIFDETNDTGVSGSIRIGGLPPVSLTGRVFLRQTDSGSQTEAVVCVSPIVSRQYSCRGMQSGNYAVRAIAFDADGKRYEQARTVSLQNGEARVLDLELTPLPEVEGG